MILGEAQISEGLRVYAIGDIHGCVDALRELTDQITDDLTASPVDHHKVVFLGDYVDRGPENRAVIDYLIDLNASSHACAFLLGNHDERVLSFIRNPALVWDDMMKWGGAKTLAGYGVVQDAGEEFASVSKRFADALPQAHVAFLQGLEHSCEIDDYFFCHAGVRPGVSLKDQADHDLIWIRRDFLDHGLPFEKVVIHGHTPNDQPEVRSNRINVDTHCYKSGVLTAVVLESNSYRFIKTGG